MIFQRVAFNVTGWYGVTGSAVSRIKKKLNEFLPNVPKNGGKMAARGWQGVIMTLFGV